MPIPARSFFLSHCLDRPALVGCARRHLQSARVQEEQFISLTFPLPICDADIKGISQSAGTKERRHDRPIRLLGSRRRLHHRGEACFGPIISLSAGPFRRSSASWRRAETRSPSKKSLAPSRVEVEIAPPRDISKEPEPRSHAFIVATDAIWLSPLLGPSCVPSETFALKKKDPSLR